MTNERESYPQHQPGLRSGDDTDRGRQEPFNELSELSLEERMAVADRIGVPVDNAGEAAATGAMSGPDDGAEGQIERMEDESTGDRTEP